MSNVPMLVEIHFDDEQKAAVAAALMAAAEAMAEKAPTGSDDTGYAVSDTEHPDSSSDCEILEVEPASTPQKEPTSTLVADSGIMLTDFETLIDNVQSGLSESTVPATKSNNPFGFQIGAPVSLAKKSYNQGSLNNIQTPTQGLNNTTLTPPVYSTIRDDLETFSQSNSPIGNNILVPHEATPSNIAAPNTMPMVLGRLPSIETENINPFGSQTGSAMPFVNSNQIDITRKSATENECGVKSNVAKSNGIGMPPLVMSSVNPYGFQIGSPISIGESVNRVNIPQMDGITTAVNKTSATNPYNMISSVPKTRPRPQLILPKTNEFEVDTSTGKAASYCKPQVGKSDDSTETDGNHRKNVSKADQLLSTDNSTHYTDGDRDCDISAVGSVDSIELSDSSNDGNTDKSSIEFAAIDLIRYQCPECGLDCGTESHWELHMNQVHNFRSIEVLNIKDMVNESGDYWKECRTCIKKFKHDAFYSELLAHRLSHTTYPKYIKCCACNEHFKSRIGVRNHITSEHLDMLSDIVDNLPVSMRFINYICPLCNKIQFDRNHFRTHLDAEHSFNETVIQKMYRDLSPSMFLCNLCSSVESSKTQREHAMTHLPYQPYQCAICKTFGSNRLYAMQKHFNTDHGHYLKKMVYRCNHCEKRFQTHEMLRQHTRNKHKLPVLRCEVCGEKFDRSWKLLVHLNSAGHLCSFDPTQVG